MKILILIAINIIAGLILLPYLPWWAVSLLCFGTGYFSKLSAKQLFVAGFCSIFLLWAGVAAFIDFGNAHILATKIAMLFHLPNTYLLLLITGLIGGLVGGFSAMTAGFLSGRR